jgi:hypothetical protein
MKTNPFRFGTVVDGEFFTNREDEQKKINSYFKTENHLVLISPRRYGKTSLLKKILGSSGRNSLFLDLQLVFSTDDFAAQLLKRIYRIYPVQKIKGFLKTFRILPSLLMNPATGEVEISFRPDTGTLAPLEDVLGLLDKLGSPSGKLIVVFDEFQEIFRIGTGLDRFLRSVLQNHRNVNYVFLGSSESMIREIFEKKSSPFYRFGILMQLGKISREHFTPFLEERLSDLSVHYKELAAGILDLTGSHPYYTQQLAFMVWEHLARQPDKNAVVAFAAEELIRSHDNNYERLWGTLNRTDMRVMAGMAASTASPLSDEFSRKFGTGPSSTVFSTLRRLAAKGLITKEPEGYIIDDPFFKQWILLRRNA